MLLGLHIAAAHAALSAAGRGGARARPQLPNTLVQLPGTEGYCGARERGAAEEGGSVRGKGCKCDASRMQACRMRGRRRSPPPACGSQ